MAQSTIDELVMEGIKYHDNGDYKEAIKVYKKAQKIDPESTLVHYEMALSYFSLGKYKKAIEYSDNVIESNSTNLLEAYLTKGSALDLLGKTEKSKEVFKTAINAVGAHYLLYYNLALNYYNESNFQEAEHYVLKAIENNVYHSTSHLMLANIHEAIDNPVQTLLAMHYFLLLEPNSSRSADVYARLQHNFDKGASKDDKESNTINISILENNDSKYASIELMISMLASSKYLEKNEGKSNEELFIENTESLFTLLGEMESSEDSDIWDNFYVPFFYDIVKSDHFKTYCKYIRQSSDQAAANWLHENKAALDTFGKWLRDE